MRSQIVNHESQDHDEIYNREVSEMDVWKADHVSRGKLERNQSDIQVDVKVESLHFDSDVSPNSPHRRPATT